MSKKSFTDHLLNPIQENPLGFGMSLFNAGLGAFTGISEQQRQLDHANDNIKLRNRQAIQGWEDAERARKMRNAFRFQERQAQLNIANQYLLPGIQRNAQLAFQSQLTQNVELDRQMAFQRQNILRQILSQRGSIGSGGEGSRSRGYERAMMMAAAPGGRQLAQLDENRIGADNRTKLSMARTQQQAYDAAVNVLAPLQMPIYQEVGTRRPLLQNKIKGPSNSGLMIGASNLLTNLAGFYGKNTG